MLNKQSYPMVNRSSDLQVSLFNLEGAIERLWTFKKWKEWKYFRSPVLWGCSSAGRAPALQAGGQEFDSPHLHQRETTTVRQESNGLVAQVVRAHA